ncbi:MAG TPA: hypothetical protein PLY87_22310 [Planctomycetaceae bacterium]|nr:hypothetical protein [Planctomycetaceae bacterium]
MNNLLLPCRFVATLTTAFLLTLTISAVAQTTPDEVKTAPTVDQRSGHDGSQQTLIATVFDKPLYLEQVTPQEAETKRKELPPGEFDKWLRGYRGAHTYDNIWGAVRKRYIEREKIGVSEEEMAAVINSVERHLKSAPGLPHDPPFPPVEQKGIAVAWTRAGLMDWKVCKSLYEKYGGRVGTGSLGLIVAFDGQNALLREHHTAGDIKFHDAEMEDEFWQHTQRENFADAYPKGERLMTFLATPPYLQPGETPPVEKNMRERIGSALGQDIYLDQLMTIPPTYHQVVQLFMAPAMEEFERKHWSEFEVTDDEVLAGVVWKEAEAKKQGGGVWEYWQAQSKEQQANVDKRLVEIKRQLDDPATPEEQRPLLKSALRVQALEKTHPHSGEVWLMNYRRKLEQYLFDNYGGGRIIHQQFGPEALDAQHKLLLGLEQAGKFEITDPALRKLAYDYWERPMHPGGFHTDRRLLEFPWTKAFQETAK